MFNLSELGVDFSVNHVVTRYNQNDLMKVAEFLFKEVGINSFTLVFFIPEKPHQELDPRIADLFVPYPRLSREVLKFAEKYNQTEKALNLCHVPPCKLDEAVLSCPNIQLGAPPIPDESIQIYRHPDCARCDYNPHCPFVFELYRRRFPDEPCDYQKVNKYADRLKA